MRRRFEAVPGDWNVICDKTGFKKKASECSMEWNGLFVRNESWTPRQPQDLVKGIPDRQDVPIARTEGVDVGTPANSGLTGNEDSIETLFPPTHGGPG